MSGAVVLALLAGALTAAALVELSARAPRRGRERSPRRSAIALLAALGRRLGVPAVPAALDARLLAAGRPLGLSAGDAMALKGGAAALGLALAPLPASMLPGRLGPAALLAAPLAGFFLPDLLLRRRTRERGRALEAELPETLDLLRVTLAAGLPLDRALEEVARHDRGLLACEWSMLAVQLALGVPRERALAELVARCPCAGVATLAQALERAFRHGAPLAETLRALAGEARAARARRLAERAARAAPQIQLVVALLLVPSVLLLVAAMLLAMVLR